MAEFPRFLIDGHKNFRDETYSDEKATYRRLATEGQDPKVLVVGCSDSRVDPTVVFNADPGDLFTVRNVANLVPPYERDGAYHGVSAALEYGVVHLDVDYVVVLGHTGCGGVRAMLDRSASIRNGMVFIDSWVAMMSQARDAVIHELPDASLEEQMVELEQRSITASIENLRSFPFIREREEAGDVALHGAYFDVGSGLLFVRDPDSGWFHSVG